MVAAVVCALFAEGTGAQRADRESLANFDVRIEKDAASAAYVQRLTSGVAAFQAGRSAARAQGAARLQAIFSGLDVVANPELGTLEVVSVAPGTGFLTSPTLDRVAAMRAFLSTYADAYGLSEAQVANLELVADYVNPAGNMAWVEFEQKINDLPVFRGLIRGGFTAQGELARTTGPLAADLNGAALATTSAFSAAQAVARAAESVGWPQNANALVEKAGAGGKFTISRGTMAGEAKAWLLYFPLTPGVARLAWATEIWGDPDVFLVLLDAEDGTMLFRKNLTNYQSQSASYTVYNDDSPAPMSPSIMLPGSGTQAAMIGRTTFSLVGNAGPLSFNNLGWMTNGANGVNGWTDGNNVEAGIDRNGVDGVDAPVSGVLRVFNFAYNPSPGSPPPGDDPLTVAFQRGEVTDGFYWTNIYHDKLYLLGFTELARNFQDNNFARGGLGADRISAEFQDSSGTDNANFTTPVDGSRGRMQMYLFPNTTPSRTSGLDHEVLIHELAHGTSNRLHNNAAGLTTTMSRGMGEGWSDFYARALLSTAGEDQNGIYTIGGWVTHLLFSPGFVDNYYYGIRRFPYAVRTNLGINGKPHNPLTFADIDPTQIDLGDGAYPKGPGGSPSAFQTHNIGEVWASALLEVRARFITRLGYATGNQRILQFVTDAMKLDPVNPTLLQGRASIVAAANAGGGTAADLADIFAGFATRGMGLSAQVVNVSTGAVVEAFDYNGINSAGGTLTGENVPNGRVDPGEIVTVSLCITNTYEDGSGSVTGTLAATGGVTSPSAPQIYGVVAAGGTVCRPYTFTVSASCGNKVTASLDITEAGGPAPRQFTYSFLVGTANVTSILSQNFDGVSAPALPAGWVSLTLSGTVNLWATSVTAPDTPLNRAFTANPSTASDNVLVTPTIVMPAGAWVLTFRNSYNTEPGFDGGVLEISIGLGAFTDIVTAGGSFVSFGYNGTISLTGGNPIAGRMAWTGWSGGYRTTSVNMPAGAAGQTIKLRWRMGTDISVASTGWSIDTITLTQTTYTCSGLAPGAFSKTTPSSGATWQPSSPLLSWGASSGATSYEYCIDTSNNNACNTSWVPVGSATSAGLVGLPASTPHYWQVRAINGNATTYANGSATAFWSFSTRPPSLVDLNGDGSGDALLYNPATGSWSRQISQPGGGFVAQSQGSWAPGWSVLPANFDGDGLTDFFLFNTTTGEWLKMLNDGGTGFTTQASGQWWSGWERYVMDLDADGISDFFLYDPATGTWFKSVSTPTGFTYTQGGWNPGWELYPMRLNGDALGDLFLISRVTGRWFWVLGEVGGGFTYPETETWFSGWQFYPGDFNGDGLTDILLHDPSTGTYFVATTMPSGFSYQQGGWSLGWTPWVVDLDADGSDDLFLHDAATGVWFQMISDGAGNFTNVGGQTWSLGWNLYPTDVNGDGRGDIILYDPVTGAWYQARNLVNGTFTYNNGTWSPGLAIVTRAPIR